MRQLAPLFAVLLSFSAVSRAQTAQASSPRKIGEASTVKTALDKTTLEQYVRHLFVWGPQIQVKVNEPKPAPLPGFQQVDVVASAGQASQAETFYVSADGTKIVRGVVYDVNVNPFAADREKIKTDLQPSFGAKDAPVDLVVYSDFQCGFCKQEAETLRKQVATTYPNQVQVYFKDFPLEPIHPWAKPAAIAGRCVFKQNPAAFWDYHDWIFENQPQIDPANLKQKTLDFAKAKGWDEAQLAACIDAKATESDVDKSMAEGRALGVNSTPTVFINGRRVAGSVPWANLKSVIDHEIEYAKNKVDAKCCEVKLPSALNP